MRESIGIDSISDIAFAVKCLLPRLLVTANTWHRRDRSSRELAGRRALVGKSFVVIAHSSLVEASHFVQILEERQGLRIPCPQEIALRQRYISLQQFERWPKKTATAATGNI